LVKLVLRRPTKNKTIFKAKQAECLSGNGEKKKGLEIGVLMKKKFEEGHLVTSKVAKCASNKVIPNDGSPEFQ